MKHTATHRIPATIGRRRGPAVIALAMAAGVAVGACSADPATGPAPAPATQAAPSSSSPVPPPGPPQSVEQISYPLAPPAPAPAPVAPTPAPELPAHVVATGGPCQMLGQVAQADDGSALFCTEDPGGAGPLWLPADVGDGAATNDDSTQAGDAQAGAGEAGAATHAGVGQAYNGGPCMQEGLAVSGPGGAVLTCSLTGGGDVPGGLYWQ